MTDNLTPRWARAHPEFPAVDMPAAIPAAWIDASENGDACPRFDAGHGVTIWIDWANPAHRDVAGASRFMATVADDPTLVAESDNFERIMWAVEVMARDAART
jgi:hypothetical protein